MGRLARYWFRARLMHDLLHWMIEEHDGSIDAIYDGGEGWDFETFMAYWLSGLFVVVEGFNKLKLRDARVQKLFNSHIGDLKKFRHETYHFALATGPSGDAVIQQLNWAEELHEAIGDYLREQFPRKPGKVRRALKKK
jgi:hypothetical protein